MDAHELVEIYVALDAVEVSAVTALLEAEGIRVHVRDMSITPYPVTIGPLGEKRIAVPAGSEAAARRVLERAVRNGYLRTGRILERR